MFYPEAPDIGHLWVDVGLQGLGRHPLVRRRLVAPAPVLGHLRTMMITMMMMLMMMAIVDLVRVISSLGWRAWCYHGHGQAEVSNLVIRIVIIMSWWSDFEEEILFLLYLDIIERWGEPSGFHLKWKTLGNYRTMGRAATTVVYGNWAAIQPKPTILQEFMVTDRVGLEKNMFHIAAWNKFRWHPFHCLKSAETFQRCLRENARMASMQIFLLKRGIGRDWK